MKDLKKLIIYVFVLILSFGFSIKAEASITTKLDNHGNKLFVRSYNRNIDPFSSITFAKLYGDKDSVSYQLTFSQSSATKLWFFAKGPLLIKVDDKHYVLRIDNTSSITLGSNEYQRHLTSGDATIDAIIDEIKGAKLIGFGVFFENHSSIARVLIPDDVLTEWKEVIDTEK